MKIKIPDDVKIIMNLLNSFCFESYVVGGCVRDSLLGLIPKDWDICTNALPNQIVGLFEDEGYKVIPTGLKHGTVTIVINNSHYEITTFRLDGKYSDCRRPDCVNFTSSLKEDLARRDFTINAMAYNDEVGLVDYFNSLTDVQEKCIKSVGNPNDRFNEDALRMLRGIRLATNLNFLIDSNTSDSILKNKKLIQNISAERIRDEICKILNSNSPCRGIELLRITELLDIILPELQQCYGFKQYNPNHNKDVYYHILRVLENTPDKLELRLAALLHDIGKPNTFSMDDEGVGHFYKHHLEGEKIARQILARLRFDNKTIDNVCILVREHMSRHDFLRVKNTKKFINRVGVDNLDNLFELQIADIKGSANRDDVSKVLKLKAECERILNEKQPLSIKDLNINGNDLIQMGVPQGKDIGLILNNLLDIVLETPEVNTKDELMKIVESRM